MADTKISALTVATTPLAGTEVLPIVQSGVTKQVSVADLTAGRAVSALSLSLTNALTATNGGTGQSSYAVGDLLYASTTTALSKLADVATGNALISGGVGVAPSWGKIGLTTHVSGTLPTANGGTNLTSFTSGGVLYASSTSALTTGTALQFNGKVQGVGAAPSTWYTTYNGVQINTVGTLISNGDFFAIGNNVLTDASANETFLTSAYGLRYRQVASSGKHEWYATATSGTAGNAATLNLLATLFPSGGMSLGNTTDPGASNLSVTGTVKGANGLFSKSGNVSATSGVATTLFTVGSGEIYLVSVVQDNGDGNVFWIGTTTGRFNTSITNITAIASAFLTAGASGTSFQITQSTGATRTLNWFAIKLCGI